MNTGRVLFSMLKADFLERTRRTGFLLTLCMVIYIGYAVNSGTILIKLDTYRGIYNSAWVGSLMALVITFFLGVTGFYLVKNTIARDESTGVGQIIATTPLTRPQYLLGKWLSNVAVLSALVGILALAAVIMQILYREDPRLDIWALVAPLLFVALPMMTLVAAFAVFFETVSWLKGGFGNIAYFGLFLALFMAGIFLTEMPWLDATGVSLIGSRMRADAAAAVPNYSGSFVLAMISDGALQTFVWHGLNWTPGLILQRLSWWLVAAAVVLLGVPFFNRFDPSRRWIVSGRKASSKAVQSDDSILSPVPAVQSPIRLTPLGENHRFHFNFLRLAWLEILLFVKGLKWYWLAGFVVLWIGCVAAPSENLRKYWYMLISIWPVLLWARMGEREARWQVEQLVYQAAYPLLRLFTAAWLAGVTLTAVSASSVLLGRFIAGEPLQLLAWVLAVLFIPTLALAFGIWSRGSKLFEVVYLILWYLGPFNRENGLAVIDYLGIHQQSPAYTSPVLFGLFLAGLLLLALLGRLRQIIL